MTTEEVNEVLEGQCIFDFWSDVWSAFGMAMIDYMGGSSTGVLSYILGLKKGMEILTRPSRELCTCGHFSGEKPEGVA